jgi:hypothetical protein
MKGQDFDHILSKEQQIIPSSGFVISVMDAVRRESAVPPPLPFPWKRALPGIFAAGVALLSTCVAASMLFIQGSAPQPLPARLQSTFSQVFKGWNTVGASWITLALVVSLVSVKLSMHFASRNRIGEWSETPNTR